MQRRSVGPDLDRPDRHFCLRVLADKVNLCRSGYARPDSSTSKHHLYTCSGSVELIALSRVVASSGCTCASVSFRFQDTALRERTQLGINVAAFPPAQVPASRMFVRRLPASTPVTVTTISVPPGAFSARVLVCVPTRQRVSALNASTAIC